MLITIEYPETNDLINLDHVRRVEADHRFYYIWTGTDLQPEIYIRSRLSKIKVLEEST